MTNTRVLVLLCSLGLVAVFTWGCGSTAHEWSPEDVSGVDQQLDNRLATMGYSALTPQERSVICSNYEKAEWLKSLVTKDNERTGQSARASYAHIELPVVLWQRVPADGGPFVESNLIAGYCAHKLE